MIRYKNVIFYNDFYNIFCGAIMKKCILIYKHKLMIIFFYIFQSIFNTFDYNFVK